MKKVFALLDGDVVLCKSESRNELVKERDQLLERGFDNVSVCTFLGRVQIDEEGNCYDSLKKEIENESSNN